MEPIFFGFKPEDRPHHHNQIWELMWFGEGRWDWNTLYYDLTVPLRRFWTKKMNRILQSRLEQQQNNNPDAKNKKPPDVAKGPF